MEIVDMVAIELVRLVVRGLGSYIAKRYTEKQQTKGKKRKNDPLRRPSKKGRSCYKKKK